MSDEQTQVQAKFFRLADGSKVPIPEGFIKGEDFKCTNGLKLDNGEQQVDEDGQEVEKGGLQVDDDGVIPLTNYTGSPATEEHLKVIFEFHKKARENGADKNARDVKIPDWAITYFNAINKDTLIETTNLASYMLCDEFTENALSHIARQLHTMTTIDEMRAYLNEKKDFKEDEFDLLAREKSWRQDLLKWGLVSEEKAKQYDDEDKKKDEQKAQRDAEEKADEQTEQKDAEED